MDIYAEITNRIIGELENGIIPWEKPWAGVSTGAVSHSTGRPYSLINQFLLGRPGEYLTFKQCKEEGGRVKKGSKSKMVVFWKILHKEKKTSDGSIVRDENGMPVDEAIPMLRYYSVFHIDDCEGIQPKYSADNLPSTAEAVDIADCVIADYSARAKLTIEHSKQDKAFYSPSRHLVSVPLMEQFENSAGYYETVFHELVHSTGHKTLLNRFAENDRAASFGSESYSKEELVAEIGACGILHELGMETAKSFRNNAAYIQNWLQVLKNDKRFIVSAAGKAEKAAKMILGIQ